MSTAAPVRIVGRLIGCFAAMNRFFAHVPAYVWVFLAVLVMLVLALAIDLGFRAVAEKWQTGIGAVIGFSGLIVAALYNAELNRRRDSHLRNEEAKALALALRSDVYWHSQYVQSLYNTISEMADRIQSEKTWPTAKSFDLAPVPVFERTIEKFGILGSDLCDKTAAFYSYYLFLKTQLEVIRNSSDRQDIIPPQDILDHLKNLLGVAETIVDELDDFAKNDDKRKT